ncbi:hypothetical protein GQ457_01G019420 [Hibiscus cannabinus]
MGGIDATGSGALDHYLRYFKRVHSPKVLALSELWISGRRADRLCWDDEVELDILQISLKSPSFSECIYFTMAYASPSSSKRRALWDQLEMLNPRDSVSWFLGGDFNVILNPDKRRVVLIYMSMRLDKSLANTAWSSQFPASHVCHLQRNDVIGQEESFWRQKAFANWVFDGDCNTSFFHASTMSCRSSNFISGLKINGKNWCDDQDMPRQVAVEFYKELFKSSGVYGGGYVVRGKFAELRSPNLDIMLSHVANDEIKAAFFYMSPLKAPEIDGLHADFY